MSDRLWFSIAAAIAVLMIGFAAVWPQGFGARSPGPFGHAVIVPTPPQKPAGPTAPGADKFGMDNLSMAPTPPDQTVLRPRQ
jgi:hypothetical protein